MSDDTNPERVADAAFEEPIDAEFRPAEPERVKVKRGPGWFSTLLLFLLAAAGGGAIGYSASELAPGHIAPERTTEIAAEDEPPTEPLATQAALEREAEARRDAASSLTQRLDRLDERLASTEDAISQPAEPGDPVDGSQPVRAEVEAEIAALKRRLAALETAGSEAEAAPEELTRAIASLSARLEEVEGSLATLQAGLEARGETDAALRSEIEQLNEDSSALQSELGTLRGDLETRQAEAGARQAELAEAALALSQIDAAARRGQGFAPALSTLRRLRPDARGLDALQDFAAEGAPTLQQLTSRFDAMAEAVTQASRPLAAPGGAISFVERVFGDAVEIRREGQPDVRANLEAAETALDNDDLGGAIDAIAALEGNSAEAAAGWLRDARARRMLERTLDGVRLDLMAEDR